MPKKEEEIRWEFCPYCGSGWTKCLGLTKDKTAWQYACTHSDCEAFFKVPVGQGEMDKRIGMELNPKVLYWMKCDDCKKEKPCRVVDLRVYCSDCYNHKE